MAQASRTKWLIVAGACLVAISLPAVVFLSNERELRARDAVRAKTAFLMLELKEDMDAAALAMNAFNQDGGLDLSGLRDKTALDRRTELAAKAQAAAEHVLTRGESAPDRLGQSLAGIPADRIAEAKQQLAAKLNWDPGQESFATHARAYAAARAQLEFLRKHHGRWRIDAAGLRVNWDSKPLQADAEQLHEQVAAAKRAQEAMSMSTSTTATATAARTTLAPATSSSSTATPASQ